MRNKVLPALAFLYLAAQPVLAAAPPCNPCAGVRIADVEAIAASLTTPPVLEGEQRLYVVWSTDLDGSAATADFETVRQAGGTPWLVVRFLTPSPILEHLETFEKELEDLARLANGAGERAHFQIDWRVDGTTPAELGFLLKRAAVVVTGGRPDARVLVGPLAPDADALRQLYAEEVAAYIDGVAFEPGDRQALVTARAQLTELDPGKPAVLDALPWPQQTSRSLARAAENSVDGFAVTLFDMPNPSPEALMPLKLLAREFEGDLSFDPYTQAKGPKNAWTFVRGSDLGLRIIAETPEPVDELELYFEDRQLRSPSNIDLSNGEDGPVFGQRRTEKGIVLPIQKPGPVVLVRLERMTAAELEGIEEQVDIRDQRQMPVEEILRRLQAFEDDQARKLESYQSINTLHLRFLLGNGAASLEASFEGDFFYRQGESFDWVWRDLYVDGVKWKGKKLPEIPLIQPEKAAALPVEISLDKEYSYRLRGTAQVNGRDCWVVDFEPVEIIEGRSLYQGTVWVDRDIFARVQTRTLQLGLDGNVLSNEETVTFQPLNEVGAPAPWSPDSYVLPTRVVGQQLLSLLNATVPVETETTVASVRINPSDFEVNRQAALDSDATMVRDTDQGLRYLVKGEDGERVVQEEIDTTRTFLVGGTFYDESLDFPLPLAGINYLALDWRGTGSQVNIFFAGALVTANIAQPRLFGSKWDAGANLFGFFIKGSDELYRDGIEVEEEVVRSRTSRVSVFLGRPIGNFAKLDFTYSAGFTAFDTDDETAEVFVLPQDTLTQTLQTELSYNRAGYRLQLAGSINQRSDWEFWGLPGNTEFDQEQEDYIRWQATFAKTWWLPKFMKLGVELEHLNGEDLDRFSSYDFGIFGDSSVAGYPSGLVRADEANGLHLNYGLNFADVFRIELEGDAVWASNETTGLDDELLAGIGLEGTITLPWQVLANFEIGKAIEGPSDGISARIVFLKLFGSK